jgi:uncharacterized protein YndB with AHSA1/START domain
MSRPRHVFETYIKATPQQIWEALTKPEFTRRYFFHSAINCGWESDSGYTYDSDDGTPVVQGNILEATPPHRLVMTFQLLFSSELALEPPSKVTWEITQVGEVCRLTCIHTDLAKAPITWSATASGWSVVLQSLKTLIETGDEIGEIPDDGKSPFSPHRPPEIEWHRTLAIEANNATHKLLDLPDRSADDNDRMIHQAHAAAHHWRIAGTIENWARAEYMCSRVYSFVGRAEPALHHAQQCMDFVQRAELVDWDLAYAHEALARALACNGQLDEARLERQKASDIAVTDPEDKSLVDADIAIGPWYGA